MIRLVICTCGLLWSLHVEAQRFLKTKSLTRNSVTTTLHKSLEIPKLSIPDIYDRMFGASVACNTLTVCGPLPVTLLSFEARRVDVHRVRTYWQTANEVNVASYFVERSLGNNLHFIDVANILAREDSKKQKRYEFIDLNAFDETSYYRLRITDVDGRYTYSNIVAVKGFLEESLKIFPNPVQSQLQLYLVVSNTDKSTTVITNALGNNVLQRTGNLVKGNNSFTIPVGHLPKGVYTLKVLRSTDAPLVTKFIKL